VTDPDEVNKAAQEIKTNLGSVSILVNNAGIGHDFPILSAPPARVKKLIEVNLISHW
jgi:NAD(P)-dependent dehydrogenase (short-subunit alcohol dehydrogenase family)